MQVWWWPVCNDHCPFPVLCQKLFPAGEAHVRGLVLRQWRLQTPLGRKAREALSKRVGLDVGVLEAEFPPEMPLPPLWQQAANYAAALLAHGRAGLKEAPEGVQAERQRVCEVCPSYRPSDGKCAECGCALVASKLRWAEQTCPLGKWEAYLP